MWAFLRKVLFDGDKESYGRTMATPFLIASLLSLCAGVILNLLHGEGILEEAGSLAMIGFSLYTGSKYLSVKGQKIQMKNSEKDTESQ